ncbi:Uncharacterized protein dnm_048290 [Desulfonema magnum]|uniref:Uncharacterized protein n=1 Tax=Desulfonema magnum TaxID=45655 RepID=A0A975GPF0_9BACT|nr:Uncharacterized protein dnm_048290 [Desulfonema magnum]
MFSRITQNQLLNPFIKASDQQKISFYLLTAHMHVCVQNFSICWNWKKI